MFDVVCVPVVESPFPYMDKKEGVYKRTTIEKKTKCSLCSREIPAGMQGCFVDARGLYYCPSEINVIEWSDLWHAHDKPSLDCKTKGIWYQLTETGEGIKLMVNNEDAKNTHSIEFYYGTWAKFIKGARLFDDLRKLRGSNNGMILVCPTDNDAFIVQR